MNKEEEKFRIQFLGNEVIGLLINVYNGKVGHFPTNFVT
jgi:hypothetical protein